MDPQREETLAKITLKELERRSRFHEGASRSPFRFTYLVYIILLWSIGLLLAMALDMSRDLFFTTLLIAQALLFFLIWESQSVNRRLDALLKLLDLQLQSGESADPGV